MARSHGKILSDIWRNPEWRSLTSSAQRTYMMLLSQPRLTLCGTLDVTLSKWASLAGDTSTADIDQALAELEDRGFIVIDHATDELAIRTFTRHDIASNRFNSNLAKGLWAAWRSIISDEVRDRVIDEIPSDLWTHLEPFAPAEAVQTRRSNQRWGSGSNQEAPSGSNQDPVSESNPLSPVSCLLSPSLSSSSALGQREPNPESLR